MVLQGGLVVGWGYGKFSSSTNSGGLLTSVWIWDLLEGKRLFHAKKGSVLDDEQHLAEMVSLMGNPPPEFLGRSETSTRFFDDAGQLFPLRRFNTSTNTL
jgi:hypothetical protein